MASIIDSFQESINEKLAYVKIFIYSIPVYFLTQMYLSGKMALFTTGIAIYGIFLIGVMSQGINNIRMNKIDILTLNPLRVAIALLKTALVMIPQGIVLGFVGHYLVMTLTSIPLDIPHYNMIIMIVVWSIIGSLLLTSFLSFSKYLRIQEGYNFKIICESCVDVFLSTIFFVPQLLIVDAIVFGPIYLLFNHYGIPFTNWGYVAFFSVVVVINFSMLTNYFAQSAYEQIKGNNEDYDDNYNKIDMIDEAATRMNGH